MQKYTLLNFPPNFQTRKL